MSTAPDTPRTISRSSFAFLSGTFLSRLTGLGRDAAMAFAFGSNPAIAAFMVAFRFTNLIRRLFGEGPLTSGFIPHFEGIRLRSPETGAKFFRDLLFSLAFFLIFLIGGIEVILWSVLQWGNLQPDNVEILQLTMWMLPGVLFICLFGLCSGFLQCERRFFMTGFAPVAFNLVWMGAVFFLRDQLPAQAMLFLSFAIIFAFFMQWVMLLPRTIGILRKSLNFKECFSPRLFSLELRQMIKPLFLGIIGIAAVQINSTLDAIFARYASLEGPAFLWYAIRIEQVPLALFGIALSTALLPPLARALKEGMYDRYLHLLRFAMRRVFSLIFPCTLAIFVLGVAGINLLYGHGDFSAEATYQTTLCLWAYGLGLLPAVFVLLLAPAFYANKNFRIPTIGSVLSMILNALLTAFCVFVLEWGAFSIAIATSLAAWFNYFYLSICLSKQMGIPLLDKEVFRSFWKTGIASVIAASGTLLVGIFFVDDPTLKIVMGEKIDSFNRIFSLQAMQFLALNGTFLLLFFSYAWLMRAEDALELLGIKPLLKQKEEID